MCSKDDTRIPCNDCEGDGTTNELCGHCSGSGEGMHDGTTCHQCHGQGELGRIDCHLCKGEGTVPNPAVVPVSTQFEHLSKYATLTAMVEALHAYGITQERILSDFLALYERKTKRAEDALDLLDKFDGYMELLDD